MERKDKSKGWMWLYIFAGGMDFIQFVIIECILVWFLGIGALINEAIDPVVGVALAVWIQFGKKVSLITRPQRLLSMVGTEAVAAVTGGIAQLWILDVWYIHHDVKREEAELREQEEQQKMMENPDRPLNMANEDGGGIRMPDSTNYRNTAPLNSVGNIRPSTGRPKPVAGKIPMIDIVGNMTN